MKKYPIGISEFSKVINGDYYYIDKTLFIEEIIETGAESILLPRPRRFGKTLNMSMLHAFFDQSHAKENRMLFEGLKIVQTKSWEHQGKYPVIFLSFKDVKEGSFEDAIGKIKNVLKKSVKENKELLSSDRLEFDEIEYLERIIKGELSVVELSEFLQNYSMYLQSHYGEKVFIVIDEYDSCIIKAWEAGYYEEMISFMRNFLSAGFKDNSALFKGVITGILRVAKESIFSGLNNLQVFTVLESRFADKFGLTESEVIQLLKDSNHSDQLATVREWYNGYQFDDYQIYNPWSILNYLDDPKLTPKPYWVNTSSNELVAQLLLNANASLEKTLIGLLNNESEGVEIEEYTIFSDLMAGEEKTVLGLLLFNGYLTITSAQKNEDDIFEYGLKIPNKELTTVYKQMLQRLLKKSDEVESSEILKGLLDQNKQSFEYNLSKYLLTSFSHFDVPKKGYTEKVYHAFILGLMAHLSSRYIIKSNPETGLGRADLLIYSPDNKDRKGWVFEFKAKKDYHKESLKEKAQEALLQIHSSAYLTELKQHHKTELMLVGVAFDGKEVACEIELQKEG